MPAALYCDLTANVLAPSDASDVVEPESVPGGHGLSGSMSRSFVVSLAFIVYKGLAQLLARKQAFYPPATELSPQHLYVSPALLLSSCVRTSDVVRRECLQLSVCRGIGMYTFAGNACGC